MAGRLSGPIVSGNGTADAPLVEGPWALRPETPTSPLLPLRHYSYNGICYRVVNYVAVFIRVCFVRAVICFLVSLILLFASFICLSHGSVLIAWESVALLCYFSVELVFCCLFLSSLLLFKLITPVEFLSPYIILQPSRISILPFK